MRFALDASSEVGQRTARILLGDERCDSLVMASHGWRPRDGRVVQSRDVTGVDVAISDGTTPLPDLIGRCSVSGVPLVVWPDGAPSDLGPASVPVVVGANLGSTLADALLTHPASMPTDADTVRVAWTEPGTPYKKGTAIAFPEPVGMAWARKRSNNRYVAHRDDEWAAAMTMVEGPDGHRTVGVSDHGPHLEALILAAVGLVAAEGAFEPGIQSAASAMPLVLAEARNLELDVAVWRSSI